MFWIKTVVCTHKCTFGPEKTKKNYTFYSKNEVFAPKMYILDKNCSFVSKNVHLVLKKKKLYFLL